MGMARNTARRSVPAGRNSNEQNRIYDEATEGEVLPDTAPSSGGRAIDQLKSDLIGTPLDDNEGANEFAEEE